MPIHYQTVLTEDAYKEIIPKVKLVPEAKPRDTNNWVALFPLSILGRKHILMAEGPII